MSNPYAPTQTVNIPPEVLEVLTTQMEWGELDGQTTCVMPPLDRDLYLKTNKVLEALGGKWNRKAKAHLFASDPRPDLGIVIDSGSLTVVRDGFFPTPLEVGIMMAELADLSFFSDVLEPSAGAGDLVKAIGEVEPDCYVKVIEIDDTRRAALIANGYHVIGSDFLTYHGTHDRIIQNPPFENLQDVDHVLHAYECLKPGGILVSIMCESVFFQETKKAASFRAWLAEHEASVMVLDPAHFNNVRTRVVRIEKRGADPQPRLF